MAKMPGRNGGTLHRVEKGDKALPGAGRPKGSLSQATKFKAFLSGKEDYEIEIDGKVTTVKMTREEILMYRLYSVGITGDPKSSAVSVSAIKEIHDRAYGKPPQDLNLGGQDSENPLNINFENLTTDELKAFLALSEKATKADE